MIIDRGQLAAALPGYEVKVELGAGAFGQVLAAQHRQLGRDVAVKVLAVNSDIAHARFLAEARLLARMDHRHIVRVHDYVEHDGLCLIIMELLAGGSLTRRLPGIQGRQACAVGVAIAEALAYAHSQRVLHRDIKPDNVLFDAAGLVKVTDFGIAKIFDGSQVSASVIAGTPPYMAPEQIMGSQLGPATDIYALGVVLYEMLAGRLPFDPGLSVFARYEQQMAMPPPPAGVPPAVADAVMHALAGDMPARPASAQDFAMELAAAAERGYAPARLPVASPAADAVHQAAGYEASTEDQPPAAQTGDRTGDRTGDQAGEEPAEPGPSASHRRTRRTRWAWVIVAAVAAVAALLVRIVPAIASHSPGHPAPTVPPGAVVTSSASASTARPLISKVAISGTAGDYELTITGSGFGPPATSFPLYGELPNFRIADSAQVGSGGWGYDGGHPLDYKAWTGSRIVVSGLGADPGNALVVALWNQDSGQGVTWGGDVPPAAKPGPVITSVHFTGPLSDPKIVIRGTGFGAAPVAMPYTGSIQNFAIGDWRVYHAGNDPPSTWTGGVTEKFLSWSPTAIVLGGFGGAFGRRPDVLEPSDPLSIQIWSPASSYDTGPQTAWGGRAAATSASAPASTASPKPRHTPAAKPSPKRSRAPGGAGSTLVIRHDTELTADVFCSNLTIEPGVTLTTDGYNIYCSGTVDNDGTIVTGSSTAQDFPRSYGGSGAGSAYGPSGVQPEATSVLGLSAGAGFSTRSLGGASCTKYGCIAANGATPAPPSLSLSMIRAWYQAGMNQYLAGAAGGSSPVAKGGSGANGLFIQASRIIAGTIDSAGGAGQTLPELSSAGGGGGGVVILAYVSSLTPGDYAFDGGYATAGDGSHHEFGGNGAVIAYQSPGLPIPVS